MALLLTAGCGTLRSVVNGGCEREWRPLRVTRQALQVTPGEVRPLGRPWVMDGPFGDREVDSSCRALYRVRGSDARVVRGTLRVPADARPGTSFLVQVFTAGVWGWQRAWVVSPQANPLAGTWSQRGEGACEDDRLPLPRIGELIFMRNGQYSYTRQPFERMVDYSGTYRVDAASGKLLLSQPVAPGEPPRESGHPWRITSPTELFIGDFNGGPGCSATFERRGGEP